VVATAKKTAACPESDFPAPEKAKKKTRP